MARSRRFWLLALALAAVTALGALLRLYRLGEIPPGLFFDEAGQGLDVQDLLSGRSLLFFDRSNGKEPLFIYWSALFAPWLPVGAWAVRLPAALAGVATIPAAFFLTRELTIDEFGPRADGLALLSAGLLAGSYWAVSINRLAFRVNLLPLVMALAFGLIWHAYRRGGLGLGAAGGALLGLCFYTYIAARVVYPLALVILLLLALMPESRRGLVQRRHELLVAAGVCLLVMLPLTLHFVAHPQDFVGRTAVIGFSQGETSGAVQQLFDFPRRFLASIGMFGGPGDAQARHNLPHRSILTPWLALLFWLGVLMALIRVRRLGRMVTLVWLGMMLLPAALAGEEPRHFLRTFGALPVVFLFPALAVVELLTWLRPRTSVSSRVWKTTLGLVLACLILAEALVTAQTYFGRWSSLPELTHAFRSADVKIAAEINAMPDGVRAVVPLAPLWRGLNGNYTLDYLVERPDDTLLYLPDAPDAAQQLADFLFRPGMEETRIVRYTWGQDADADPRNLTGLFVGQIGRLSGQEERDDYVVEHYEINGDPSVLGRPSTTEPLDATFSDGEVALTLDGWRSYPSGGTSSDVNLAGGGDGIIALDWNLAGQPSTPLRISLRLLDALGKPVGQNDSFLTRQTGTETESTVHPITAAAGTPPGVYSLQAIFYADGDGHRLARRLPDGALRETLLLGEIIVGAPSPDAGIYAPDFAWDIALPVTDGLALLGVAQAAQIGLPGLPHDLTLAWSVAGKDVFGTVQFALEKELLVTEPLRLPADGLWRTTHRLTLPASLEPGDHPLRLRVDEGDWLTLGEVRVEPMPVADEMLDVRFADGISLIGQRIEEDGERLSVTLFWRHEPEVDDERLPDYSSFVHVIDASGALLAQHDGQPGEGRYPAGLWPPGVTIPDRHELTLPADVDPSELRLRIGLYLAATGLRLSQQDGTEYVDLDWKR